MQRSVSTGRLQNFVTPLHEATKRDCLGRMNDDKVSCMSTAKKYGEDYWDGDRRYGYGGYKYIPGYWEGVAKELIQTYSLNSRSRILDVGCGKGYLLFELQTLLPGINVCGFDISEYGLQNAKEEIQPFLFEHRAQERYPFESKSFDLVLSLGCLHNLVLPDLTIAVKEIQRVGKRGYIMVESYRNDQELFNLQCWALTAESFFTPKEWQWVYSGVDYTGDYEFIFFV
jgi:SAM-dependent methyltransferase